MKNIATINDKMCRLKVKKISSFSYQTVSTGKSQSVCVQFSSICSHSNDVMFYPFAFGMIELCNI